MEITWGLFLKLKPFMFVTPLFLLTLNFKSGGGQLRVLEESADFDGRPSDFNVLSCLVVGPGDKKYEWYHNNTLIDLEYFLKLQGFRSFDTDSLVVNHRVVRSDLRYQGVYQLFVSSAFGRIFCRKIKVKFKVVGKFDSVPLPLIRQVTVGQPFYLKCPNHSYISGCVYKWGKSGSHFGLKHVKEYGHRVVLPDGTLFFSAIKDRDVMDFGWGNGGCSCILDCVWPEFHSATVSPEINLNATRVNVSSFGPKIITIIKDREVILGSEYIHTTCAATGSPTPSYRWVKIDKEDNEVDITETNDIELGNFNHTMTIHNINITDNGTYACIATIDSNYDMVKWDLTVREKPTWLPDGKIVDKVVNVFTKFTWECKAHGDPVPTYTWYSNGSQIVTISERYEIRGGKISFGRVLLEDSGMYQCVAENGFGFLYQTVSLHVQARKPDFNETSISVVFLKDSQGTLRCLSNAIPRANYTWTKNGFSLPPGMKYNIHERHDGEHLVISRVTEEDTGVYECIAENVFGKAEQVTNVTIEDITFVMRPASNLNISKGTSFSLYCKVSSSRPVQYKWRINGQDLRYDEKHIWVKNANRLLIQDANETDSGLYECVAYITNPAKVERSSVARILITGPPDALEGFRLLQQCNNFTATLTWHSLPIYNDSKTKVIIEWRTTYEDRWHRDYKKAGINAIVGRTKVENLSPWSKIQFRATTQNTYGNGPACEATKFESCKTSPTRPVKCPENILVVNGSPGVLDIKWKAMTKIDFNGPGFNYVVKYKRPKDSAWKKTVVDRTQGQFRIPSTGTNQLWYFTLQPNNSEGLGPLCLENTSHSGQSKPGLITHLNIKQIGTSSVLITWLPPISDLWNIDGYKLEYGEVEAITNRKKRMENIDNCNDISRYPCSLVFLSGQHDKYRLSNLSTMTQYNISLKAYNSQGNGPPQYSSFQTKSLNIGETKSGSPMYKRNWFITVIAVIALLMFIILLVIFILNIRRSDRYPVGKRERKKGGFHNLDDNPHRHPLEPKLTEDKPDSQESGMYISNGSTMAPGDAVSLPLSTEDKYDDDGSFVGEYCDLTLTKPKKYDEMFV